MNFGVLLASVSFALAFFYLCFVIYRFIEARKYKDDDWRDPPPMIYKMFKPIVKMIAPDIKSALSEAKLESIEKKLSSAGMTYAIMPEEYVTLRFVCLLVGCLITSYVVVSQPNLAMEFRVLAFSVIPISYFYPDIWLNDQIKKRRNKITKDFPFLLDLLVLSMKAGLNYSSALHQAVTSLNEGPVKEDFSKLLREIRAGRSRQEALLDLAERVNISSLSNFVAAMNQAEETGGEIVEVLVTQSEQRRAERFLMAEEEASKAPVKMLIPMMACLFPIIFMLIAFILAVGMAESNVMPPELARLFM